MIGSAQHFNYRPSGNTSGNTYEEDKLYRGDAHHDGQAACISGGSSNFKIDRLPSVEDVYLHPCELPAIIRRTSGSSRARKYAT
jgi:hypothetical protein